MHAADDLAIRSLAEGRLVDEAVGANEAVVGPVEFAASVTAILLGLAIVLGLKHPPRAVAKADQGSEALAGVRAAGGERSPAVDHANG
jgi:hypothetical protein